MTETRRIKKSESLEVRLSHPAKQAFMARCQAEGRTASETLREFIEAQPAPAAPAARSKRPARLWIVGGFATAALAAVAAPSLARPAAAAQFEALDANADGAIVTSEFARLDVDGDGRVSRAEFTRSREALARP